MYMSATYENRYECPHPTSLRAVGGFPLPPGAGGLCPHDRPAFFPESTPRAGAVSVSSEEWPGEVDDD